MDTVFHLRESWQLYWREVRDIYNNWTAMTAEDTKEQGLYYNKFEEYINPSYPMFACYNFYKQNMKHK